MCRLPLNSISGAVEKFRLDGVRRYVVVWRGEGGTETDKSDAVYRVNALFFTLVRAEELLRIRSIFNPQ